MVCLRRSRLPHAGLAPLPIRKESMQDVPEGTCVQWFRQVRRAACFDGPQLVPPHGLGREGNDGDQGCSWIGLETTRGLVARHAGELHVHEDQVRMRGSCEGERRIGRLGYQHLTALLLQEGDHQFQIDRVILHNKHARHVDTSLHRLTTLDFAR
jgi:hypothetical protein